MSDPAPTLVNYDPATCLQALERAPRSVRKAVATAGILTSIVSAGYLVLGPAPAELFSVLASSLLTAMGVLPALGSVMLVGRPVAHLDRGMLWTRGWMAVLLRLYGFLWVMGLALSLGVLASRSHWLLVGWAAIAVTLLATFMTPIVFLCFANRLSAESSTQIVVALVCHDGTPGASLDERRRWTKSLRDVAIQEFAAGNRHSCEQRLLGLSSITLHSPDEAVRLSALDELSFVAAHDILDRDLALYALRLLQCVLEDSRAADLSGYVASEAASLLRAALSEGASTAVTERAYSVFHAAVATSKRLEPKWIPELLEAMPRRPRAATHWAQRLFDLHEAADREPRSDSLEELLAICGDDTKARLVVRLHFLESRYRTQPGTKAAGIFQDQAVAMAGDFLPLMDPVHPSPGFLRANVDRAFAEDRPWLFLQLAKDVLQADWADEADARRTDPRGAVLAEVLWHAFKYDDERTLEEMILFVERVNVDLQRRLAPALGLGVERVVNALGQSKAQGRATSEQCQEAAHAGVGRPVRLATQIIRTAQRSGDLTVLRRAIRSLHRAQEHSCDCDLPAWTAALGEITRILGQEAVEDPSIASDARSLVWRHIAHGWTGMGAVASELVDGLQPEELDRAEVTVMAEAICRWEADSPSGRDVRDDVNPTEVLTGALLAWVGQQPEREVLRVCHALRDAEKRASTFSWIPVYRTLSAAVDQGARSCVLPALWVGLSMHDGWHDPRASDIGEHLSEAAWTWLSNDAAFLIDALGAASSDDMDLKQARSSVSTWLRLVLHGLGNSRSWEVGLSGLGILAHPAIVPGHAASAILRQRGTRGIDTQLARRLLHHLVSAGRPDLASRFTADACRDEDADGVLHALAEALSHEHEDRARTAANTVWGLCALQRESGFLRVVRSSAFPAVLKECELVLAGVTDDGAAETLERLRRLKVRSSGVRRGTGAGSHSPARRG